MAISQKGQYALRALFELAKHYGHGPVKIAEIAEAQAIPARFLEVILSELKRGAFVASKRGREGGYLLDRSPRRMTAGEVIRFVEGPLAPVSCVTGQGGLECPLAGECAFLEMWKEASDALSGVYDGTSLQDLLERDRRRRGSYTPSYAI